MNIQKTMDKINPFIKDKWQKSDSNFIIDIYWITINNIYYSMLLFIYKECYYRILINNSSYETLLFLSLSNVYFNYFPVL